MILLAAVFAMTGSTELLQPYDKLGANPQIAWVGDFSPGTVKAIGTLELLAALELYYPGFGWNPVGGPIRAQVAACTTP